MYQDNVRRPSKKDSSKVANFFSASSKFKNAVKLVTQKSDRRKSVESSKIILNSIVLKQEELTNYESKLFSQEQKELALGLDMVHDLENLLRERNKSNNLVDSRGI